MLLFCSVLFCLEGGSLFYSARQRWGQATAAGPVHNLPRLWGQCIECL